MMTTGEKMIWAAAFAHEYRAAMTRRQEVAGERLGLPLAMRTAGFTVDAARGALKDATVMISVQEGHAAMLREMVVDAQAPVMTASGQRLPKEEEVNLDIAIRSEHEQSIRNKVAILESALVGCFHCLRLMPPDSIGEWVRDGDGETGVCPFCGIDSLLPRMDVKTCLVLFELQRAYFGTTASSASASASPDPLAAVREHVKFFPSNYPASPEAFLSDVLVWLRKLRELVGAKP